MKILIIQVCHLTILLNLCLGTTPRPLEVNADPDIKTKVGTFIHKQFGQSKRISQQDKKIMEKWLSEQLQAERKIR
jgi:hypothetical protein